MRQLIQTFCEIDDGATAIEYALLATMVAIGAFAAIVNLGDTLQMMFDVVESGVSNSI
jgi:Flp pilus assembly pilin Flp